MPEVVFVMLDVPVDVLAERLIKRTDKAMKDAGMDIEAWWNSEEDPEAVKNKAKWGEYSVENVNKSMIETYLKGYEPYTEEEKACCHLIDNEHYDDN